VEGSTCASSSTWLRARCDRDIDWTEIASRFSAAGHDDVLATYLACAQYLFGQPMPQFAGVRAIAVGTRLRGVIEGPERRRRQERLTKVQLKLRGDWTKSRVATASAVTRIANVAGIPWGYAAARWRDPRGLLDLHKPSTWHRGLRRIRQAMKSPKP
jgi:hypothetical protein